MGGMGLKVGVYGGSGYAGIELVRLLGGHPEVGAMSVASRGYVGLGIGDVYPQLAVDGAYVAPEEIEASDLDVAFVAYGHGESAGAVKELLRSGTRLVIDLSADFRLPHEELYAEWYGEHPAPELLGEAHYGLPEVFGATAGRLVANPGCYPTAAILALAPVVKRMGVGIRSVTINALSGASGAGAKPSVKTHFVSVNESAGAYGAPRHRHTPEIETILRRVGEMPEVTFVPHLIPITRGELETIVVDVGELPEVEEVLGCGRQPGREAGARLGGRQPAQGCLGCGGTEHEPGARLRGVPRARASYVGGIFWERRCCRWTKRRGRISYCV